MKIGDLVKITIESGVEDLGVIMRVTQGVTGVWYEVLCAKSKRAAIAFEDMVEVISDAG